MSTPGPTNARPAEPIQRTDGSHISYRDRRLSQNRTRTSGAELAPAFFPRRLARRRSPPPVHRAIYLPHGPKVLVGPTVGTSRPLQQRLHRNKLRETKLASTDAALSHVAGAMPFSAVASARRTNTSELSRSTLPKVCQPQQRRHHSINRRGSARWPLSHRPYCPSHSPERRCPVPHRWEGLALSWRDIRPYACAPFPHCRQGGA